MVLREKKMISNIMLKKLVIILQILGKTDIQDFDIMEDT